MFVRAAVRDAPSHLVGSGLRMVQVFEKMLVAFSLMCSQSLLEDDCD